MPAQGKNVIIAGSTKCGTTSLFNYLKDHPEICASFVKETRFFWNNEYELSPTNKNKSINNYDDFFLKRTSTKWKLEATPDYMYSYKTAKRIKIALPDCRLIFILRNPLDRIFSWFKYSKQLGYLPPGFQLNDYIELLLKSDENSPAYLRALEQGKYATYLQQYINLFGEKNILIILFEDLLKTPILVMNTICGFLKIDPLYFRAYNFKIYNPSINFKRGKQPSSYIVVKQSLRKFANILPLSSGNFFKKSARHADKFFLKTASSQWDEINLPGTYADRIKEYYLEDRLLLEKIYKKKIAW